MNKLTSAVFLRTNEEINTVNVIEIQYGGEIQYRIDN